jgi:TRAP-type uncharacterized transport system fused permease subunit
MFVYGPSLLMVGTWPQIILTTVTAIIGVVALSGGLHGYFLRQTLVWERIVLVAAALVLIKPGWFTDLAGLAMLLSVVTNQKLATLRTATR